MGEDDNRAPTNLLLLCMPHAWEIDNLVEQYPAGLLREWKKRQVEMAAHAQTVAWISDSDVDAALASVDLQAVLDRVAAAVPFNPRMRTRAEAWDLATRKAMGWRLARLKPMVAPEDRDAVVTWMATSESSRVVVPPGQVRVLTGAMGAGKTEQAIRWWEEGLQAAVSTDAAEIGAYFTPRALVSGLESAVINDLGHEPVHRCRVVIDDLDSVSSRDAARLLTEARALVHTWPNVSVLATARHDAVVLADEERIAVELWPTDRGYSLLKAILGEDFYWPDWNRETLDLLTSPLTTLGLASHLKAGNNTKISRSELLVELASMAVQQNQREVSEETWQDLGRLAVALLDQTAPVAAGSFASPPRVRALLNTDLVVRENGALRFALPVFEQYFGSEAIRAGRVPLETVASADAFPMWRYALAFAVSTAEASRQEQLLLELARLNPASAFWILDEIGRTPTAADAQPTVDTTAITALIATRDCSGVSAEPALPVRVGLWLREAEEALMAGLAPLGERLTRRGGDLNQWGIWLERGYVTLARARSRVSPPVIELDEIHPSIGRITGWDEWTQFPFPAGQFGRWAHVQKHLQRRLNEVIHRRTLEAPLDGMLARERAHHLARFVTDFGVQRQGQPIILDDLRGKLATWVERANASEWSRWGQGEIDSADVWWLDTYLARQTGDLLEQPWPAGDQPHLGQFFWESYSPDLTATSAADILREAIIGYRQLVETNFPQFGNALGLYGMLPLHLEGFIGRPESGSGISSVHVTLMLHPRPGVKREAEPTTTLTFIADGTTPTVWERSTEHHRRAASTRFGQSPVQDVELPLHTSRPATNLAYQWLATDLAALGWGTIALTV
jgi:hypothetical protein